MTHKICKSEEKQMIWILLSSHKLFNKEIRMNYVPEIRNGCDVSKLFAITA